MALCNGDAKVSDAAGRVVPRERGVAGPGLPSPPLTSRRGPGACPPPCPGGEFNQFRGVRWGFAWGRGVARPGHPHRPSSGLRVIRPSGKQKGPFPFPAFGLLLPDRRRRLLPWPPRTPRVWAGRRNPQGLPLRGDGAGESGVGSGPRPRSPWESACVGWVSRRGAPVAVSGLA